MCCVNPRPRWLNCSVLQEVIGGVFAARWVVAVMSQHRPALPVLALGRARSERVAELKLKRFLPLPLAWRSFGFCGSSGDDQLAQPPPARPRFFVPISKECHIVGFAHIKI